MNRGDFGLPCFFTLFISATLQWKFYGQEDVMPTISTFYGILIKMYWDDHAPPHFHAEYAGAEAVIAIQTLDGGAWKVAARSGLVGQRVGIATSD
jgi:hypothetical protein